MSIFFREKFLREVWVRFFRQKENVFRLSYFFFSPTSFNLTAPVVSTTRSVGKTTCSWPKCASAMGASVFPGSYRPKPLEKTVPEANVRNFHHFALGFSSIRRHLLRAHYNNVYSLLPVALYPRSKVVLFLPRLAYSLCG